MSETLDDKLLGPEVEIKVDHKDYAGVLHKVGERAHIYNGHTYGVLSHDEVPLVFGKRLPFMGTRIKYIEIIRNGQQLIQK